MLSKLEKLLWWLLIILMPSQTAKHFWPSFSLVSGLRVDYLSPALYLTDIFIFLLIALNPPSISISGRGKLFLSIFIILNILFSISPALTVYKFVRLFLYLLLFFRMVQSRQLVKHIFPRALPWAVLWTGILAIFQFLARRSLGGFWQLLGERPLSLAGLNIAKIFLSDLGLFLRPYGTFPHPNALAGFLVISFWLMLYFRNLNTHKGWTNLLNLAITVSVIVLLLTFSRSGIIVFALSVLLVGKFQKKINIFQTVILSVLLILIAGLSLNFGSAGSIPERIYLLRKSIFIITKYPLMGVGLGNFPRASYSAGFNNPFIFYQPVHNIILLFMSEVGLPLFIILIIYLIKFIKHHLLFSDIYLKVAVMDILMLGMIDHYWLTSVQNLLLLTVLSSVVVIRSNEK